LEGKLVGIETWGGGNRRTKGKASKLDIIREISEKTNTKALDISALNLSDLRIILNLANTDTRLAGEAPTGRYKRDYIPVLETIFPKVKNFNKLPLSSLRTLLGAFTNV